MNELTTLTPYIHRLKVPFSHIYTSIFLIRADDGIVVFDTATYPKDIDTYLLPALDVLGIAQKEISHVVISHNHGDHAGGLARFTELFPHVTVCAGSNACAERIGAKPVRCLSDGEILCDPLKIVTIPGHTLDCVGILDTRTGSLLSGDGLQAYGIYGASKWGANVRFQAEHLAALEKLRKLQLQSLYTAHDYHPCGNEALGSVAIGQYLDQCASALYAIRDFLRANPQLDATEATNAYNAGSGLPSVGEHVMAAMLENIKKGLI